MFNKLIAIGIKVTDFNKALTFYRDTLSLNIKTEDLENQFAELSIADTTIALLTEDTLKGMSKNIKFVNPNNSTFLFAVEVDNLDESYEKLTDLGIEFIQEPKETDWGQKVAYFKDIEGYIWEISEPFSE